MTRRKEKHVQMRMQLRKKEEERDSREKEVREKSHTKSVLGS